MFLVSNLNIVPHGKFIILIYFEFVKKIKLVGRIVKKYENHNHHMSKVMESLQSFMSIVAITTKNSS